MDMAKLKIMIDEMFLTQRSAGQRVESDEAIPEELRSIFADRSRCLHEICVPAGYTGPGLLLSPPPIPLREEVWVQSLIV